MIVNILLSSVGRRAYLVHYFREALAGQGLVIATNSVPGTSGMEAADRAVLVPPAYAPEYPDTILELCRSYEIGMICALHDLDGYVLSSLNDELIAMGVIPVLPEPTWARRCLDKLECGNVLASHDLVVPWSNVSLEETHAALGRGDIAFPLLVKARFGFGSLAVQHCNSIESLNACFEDARERVGGSVLSRFFSPSRGSVKESDSEPGDMIHSLSNAVLIQEVLGGRELCIGLVNDLSGRYGGHFICEVTSMRAGESDTATTLDSSALGDLPRRLSQILGQRGFWGLDVILGEHAPVIIDVNPRFTGDYPFYHLAGANVPAALLAWAENRKVDPEWLKCDAGVRGYKELVPRRFT